MHLQIIAMIQIRLKIDDSELSGHRRLAMIAPSRKNVFFTHWWVDNLLPAPRVRAPSRTPDGLRTFI